jgi:hypothetical protein
VTADGSGGLVVRGICADEIAALALDHAIQLHQLTTVHPSLEDAYLRLTADAVEYRGGVVLRYDVGRRAQPTVVEPSEWSTS